MNDLHIPVVRVTTPKPIEEHPAVPAVLSFVEVDGQLWPVTRYVIDGSADDFQTVTLTFLADLTIVHPEPKP